MRKTFRSIPTDYKATPAKPVFMSNPPRYVVHRPLPMWALPVLCIALAVAGYAAASFVLGVL